MFKNIRIVMVNTTHPGNIGAAARALKTMGLSNMYLVSPHEYPSAQATWRAAGATDVLHQAKVVETLAEALEGCSLVLGASARQRRIPWPVLNARQSGEVIARQAKTEQVAIIFGREDRGLTNEELQQCHYHIEIPANDDYKVLNVASAIQVIAYEIRMATLILSDQETQGADASVVTMPVETVRWDERLVTIQEMNLFFEHLEQTLTDIEFYEPDNPRQLMTRLRRLFLRVHLDQMELNILRGALRAMQEKINPKK
jgi:tRNA (cytidine32/uridine32-2'-O)-methyltransferase